MIVRRHVAVEIRTVFGEVLREVRAKRGRLMHVALGPDRNVSAGTCL